MEEALQATPQHPNLRILGAGAIPPNPSELLGSQVMWELLQKLSADALVLIDAPPLLPVTDAAVLTANADGALVVVSAGKTLDTQLGSALDHLSAVEARALGVVLNRVSTRDSGSGYYDQYNGYNEQSGGKAPAPEVTAARRGRVAARRQPRGRRVRGPRRRPRPRSPRRPAADPRGSAAAIWRAVDGVRSTPAVVESVAESFGVPAAEVEADVVAFLDSLASAGLLEAT